MKSSVSAMDETASGTVQEAPSLENVILLMIDDSGKPPGASGSPTDPPEPSPDEVDALVVTGQA